MKIIDLNSITIILKKILILTIVCFSSTLFSQIKPSDDIKNNEFLDGLTLATAEDLAKNKIILDGETIPIYNIEGIRVKGNEFMTLLVSGKYTFDFYVDENHDFKAAQLKSNKKCLILKVLKGRFRYAWKSGCSFLYD